MSQLYRTLTGQSQKSTNSKDQHLTPTASVVTKTTTTDPLSGVLNHLTEPQVRKLEDFKQKLQKDGWWTPEGINGKPSHDDGTLLRYLRARKFDVAGAIGQFTDTEKWLKEQRVEELYEHFDVDIYERARIMYPQWTGHRDRRGIPIYVYVIKGLDSKNVSKYQKESQKYKDSLPSHKKLDTPAKMLPLFALYHNLLNFVLPMVSTLERPNPEIPVTNSTNIVDITGVGLTQFWNLKNHMQDASVLATAHYPETLDRIFIIGAPAFFPTVWGWIKRWFDPVTVSKIFILSKAEIKPTLERFMDPKDIPKRYGGQLDWEWGQLPDIDAETAKVLQKDGGPPWVAGPCLWLDHQRLVVGSENGKLRRLDKEIQEKKPVVYAADYTLEPVHSNRRASGTGGGANGKLDPPKTQRTPSHHAVKAAQIATGTSTAAAGEAAAVAASSNSNLTPTSKPASKKQSKEFERTPSRLSHEVERSAEAPTSAPAPTSVPATQPISPIPSHIKPENVRTAPGGSQVHLPPNQAGSPAVTAEYISNGSATPMPEVKVSAPESVKTEPVPSAPSEVALPSPAAGPAVAAVGGAAAAPTANGSATPSTLISSGTTSPPPGMTQPGPLPNHTVAVLQTTANKMEGESVSVIPADSNGVLAHPEIVVASDKSKGLAVESEKLEALGNVTNRPEMQRFVTAAEF